MYLKSQSGLNGRIMTMESKFIQHQVNLMPIIHVQVSNQNNKIAQTSSASMKPTLKSTVTCKDYFFTFSGQFGSGKDNSQANSS